MFNVEIFSTYRKIRDFINNSLQGPLPKLFTIDSFIDNIVIVPEKIKIENSLREFYLHKAIETLEKNRLSKLGIPESFYSFISFLKRKDFFFRFFEELSVENIEIQNLKNFDVYAEFEEHLSILEEILINYKNILKNNNYFDKITLDNYKLNTVFLNSINEIKIHVDGFLTNREIDILKKLDNVKITFFASPFNSKLYKNFLSNVKLNHNYTIDFSNGKILQEEPIFSSSNKKLKIYKTSLRLTQVAVVLKEIEQILSENILPEKIALIVPDESFVSFLKHFDKNSTNNERIFNFAMGFNFNETDEFKELEKFYNERGYEQFSNFYDFIEFLENFPIQNEEAEVKYKEIIFKFKHIYKDISLKIDELFFTFLRLIEGIKISDNSGGKITVMGLLESRGLHFDAVIVVDFNEGIVPFVSEKDIFLNTFIRKKAGLPTREDRENLQKHYFYSLFYKSRYNVIIYVENNEKKPSRFINELNLNSAPVNGDNYIDAILPYSRIKPHYFSTNIIKDKNLIFYRKTVTPTMLKTYLECKRMFYFKYVKSLSYEDKEEFNLGLAIHEAIKNYAFKGISKDEYFLKVWNFLKRKASNSENKLLLETWKNRIKKFIELDAENLSKVKRIISEKELTCKFSSYTLKARIDRIEIYNDKVKLIDFKTSKTSNLPLKKGKLSDNLTDFQLVFYLILARNFFKNLKIEVGYNSIAEYGKEIIIDASEKIDELAEILKNIQEEEIFEPDKRYCYFCDYNLLCGNDI